VINSLFHGRLKIVLILAIMLGACTEESPPQSIEPAPSSSQQQVQGQVPTSFGSAPDSWTLTGSNSMYAKLFASTVDALPALEMLQERDVSESEAHDLDQDGLFSRYERLEFQAIDDKIITSVASDLVVQFYLKGSEPLYEKGDDLVVWRTKDLAEILPADFDLQSDENNVSFDFEEVKLFVRDSVLGHLADSSICNKWRLWWLNQNDKNEPVRLPPYEDMIIPQFECAHWIGEVRNAVLHERELKSLRQELSLIAYGEEFVWDGQIDVSDGDLKTYDLLLDIAGAGNILGSAPYDKLFNYGNQGEQADPGMGNACLLPSPDLCGNGAVDASAEQCDDGNRFPNDGCDEFCQVEHYYCGNDWKEHWEECSEKRECPDGAECSNYRDCKISGRSCGFGAEDDERCLGLAWRKTCRYTGQFCGKNHPDDPDQDCTERPPGVLSSQMDEWRKNACRYVASGVCWIGNVIHGQECTDHKQCNTISSCDNGFCTGHPYKTCEKDTECYRCASQPIFGTCYVTGEWCNGDEDCPVSDYCMLETDDICRPRTVGGVGNNRSECNEFCEDETYCGDGIIYVYLDENGKLEEEECDPGMHCADGERCYRRGSLCEDRSTCEPRYGVGSGVGGVASTCTNKCEVQICGDGETHLPEECDDGGLCKQLDGKITDRKCSVGPNPPDCLKYGFDGVLGNKDDQIACVTVGNDGCSANCKQEACGDGIIQKNIGEECDDGGTCDNLSEKCNFRSGLTCPQFSHCESLRDIPCVDQYDCPVGDKCIPGSLTPYCIPEEGDGCSLLCEKEDVSHLLCGNGWVDPGEQCDDGGICTGGQFDGWNCNMLGSFGMGVISGVQSCMSGGGRCVPQNGDGCTAECKLEVCGNEVVDPGEECDPGAVCMHFIEDNNWEERDCTEYFNPDLLLKGAEIPEDPICVTGAGERASCEVRVDDECSRSCEDIVCGDCRLASPQEECDDGNNIDGDGCSGACETESVCGDGVIQCGEECDDGPPDGNCLRSNYQGSLQDCSQGPQICDWAGANEVCSAVTVDENGWRADPPAGKNRCYHHMVLAITGEKCSEDPDFCTQPGEVCEPEIDDCNDCRWALKAIPEDAPGFYCGDGVSDGVCEQCDDSNRQSGDGCSSRCKIEECGNCIQDVGEECDDGNQIDDDGCSNDCEGEDVGESQCGNGIIEGDEQCDDGGWCYDQASACSIYDEKPCEEVSYRCSLSGGACFDSDDCEPDEECITVVAECIQDECDGCDNNCRFSPTHDLACGNGITQCDEECDDRNTVDGDGCNSICNLEFCGDGQRDSDGPDNIPGNMDDEECDMGMNNSDVLPDACRTNCTKARCGDGVIDSSEECDFPTCPDGKPCTSSLDCGGFWCWARGDFGCTRPGDLRGACMIDDLEEAEMSHAGECDPGDQTAGRCPPTPCPGDPGSVCGPVCDAASGEVCGYGKCNLGTKTCENSPSGQTLVCLRDEDCQIPCIPTCTENERIRALPCGDGYRDNSEECDDANLINGDGCSSLCKLERPDFCGDGDVDPGEQCDQMHLYSTIECTPFCQLPQPVPQCGDKKKDPSGSARGDIIGEMLTFAKGYQLDGRWPAGSEMLPNWTGGDPEFQSAGGWYVTPRVFDHDFHQSFVSGRQDLDELVDASPPCSRCGDGELDIGEDCDSGRSSGGAHPNEGYNLALWERMKLKISYSPYIHEYRDELELLYGFGKYGGWRRWYDTAWWLRDIKKIEGREFEQEACSSSCHLQRCGNDRIDIDTGETCDDGNRWDGDGCSSLCKFEKGYAAILERCGDDVVTGGEQCDDGSECTYIHSVTGERRETNEYCRQGNVDPPSRIFCTESKQGEYSICETRSGDGCDDNCDIETPQCGNDILEPYEECDDGNKNGPNERCSLNCKLKAAHEPPADTSKPYCGDGPPPQRGEECDDGNFVDFDGCTHCLIDLCGNWEINAGEQCDDGNRQSGDGCSKFCIKELTCGNGLLEFGEQCDDGNNWSDDGCSGDFIFSTPCQFEYCGDGVVQPGLGEECDPALQSYCRLDCVLPFCGDDIEDSITDDEYPYKEICDPGKHCRLNKYRECRDDGECPLGPCNTNEGVCTGDHSRSCKKDDDCGFDQCIIQDEYYLDKVICTAECTKPIKCGDGIVQGDEECEPSDHRRNGGCTDECELERPDLCGNGHVDPGEQCDDGNRAGYDLCSETCQLEDEDGGAICPSKCLYKCTDTGELCDPTEGNDDCLLGRCEPECASECLYGLCGNEMVDPGEQCDDGRRCLNNPDLTDPNGKCTSHEECKVGSCINADPSKMVSGFCSDEESRACMTDADCRSLCLPMSGDGCSNECHHEISPQTSVPEPSAELILCQEEKGQRIGVDQTDEWQNTLLEPDRNPFLGSGGWWSWYWNWGESSYANRFSWNWWWWDTNYIRSAYRTKFPNSLGLLTQAVTSSIGSVAQGNTMPGRTQLMPLEPVGISSYGACQNPRAQLVSAVEIPALSPIVLPEYEPSELVRRIRSFICEEQGFPRRSFSFLCTPGRHATLAPVGFSFGPLSIQESATSSIREMILANTLAIGFRASERRLSDYLTEAVQSLAASLETAVRLFTDLERIEFPLKECPTDDSTQFCSP